MQTDTSNGIITEPKNRSEKSAEMPRSGRSVVFAVRGRYTKLGVGVGVALFQAQAFLKVKV